MRRFTMAGVVAALSVSLAAVGGCAPSPRAPREITLTARGMTFVLAAQPDTPNPVVPLRAGERVRLILRNEAPGLLHDLAIPAWNVEIRQIRVGESAEVTFTVPNQPGRHVYRCRPHAKMMNGFVEVVP